MKIKFKTKIIFISIILIFAMPVIFVEGKAKKDSKKSAVPPGDVLDNFDDEDDMNLWGGGMGTMTDSTSDTKLNVKFESDRNAGKAISFEYDTGSLDKHHWVGYWIKLHSIPDFPVNLENYKHLSFYVKGKAGNEPLKIEIANKSKGPRSKAYLYVDDYLDDGITTEWQEVKIPLDAFVNLDKLSNIKELNFVIENDYAEICGKPSSGTIYIDDISFSKKSLKYVKVDHFGDLWGWGSLGGNIGSMRECSSSYDSMVYHKNKNSLKSVYNTNTSKDKWCGHFIIFGGGKDGWTAQSHDFSDYSKLTLWVRSNSEEENPTVFKIELVDNDSVEKLVIPSDTEEGESAGIPHDGSWQKYTMNINNISGLDKSKIKQINIIYEDWRIMKEDGNAEGILFFDEIQFEK